MATSPERPPSSPIGWAFLGLTALVAGGSVAASSVQPGAVNISVLGAGAAPILAIAVAFVADRSGRSWGRGLALAVGIALIALGGLAEWFFWIGALQGSSNQEIGTALVYGAIAGAAAAGTGLLATAGRGQMRVAALVLATVLLPAGVGQLMVFSSQQPQGGEPAASVPALVADRDPLPSCGDEITPPTGPGPEEVAARQCLLEAFQSGGGGELRRDFKTPQGNPVTEILRVLPDGSVEVFVDATRDVEGSGRWERRVCDGVAAVEGAAVFELTACGTAATLQ